jgi:streptogramin lyase
MRTTHKSQSKSDSKTKTTTRRAEVVREYGPFPGTNHIHGVTFDGSQVWFARGESIVALNPKSGVLVRELPMTAEARTAFDGKHLWQLANDRIQKVDPSSGKVVATIPAPAHGRDSGLTWAEGTLWVGEYRARKIHQIDAGTGAILRTIESNRFVTGVSWVNGELWHATLESDESEIRHVNPETGEVLERLQLPAGVTVSGTEADGAGVFYCGGAGSGKVRAVRRAKR